MHRLLQNFPILLLIDCGVLILFWLIAFGWARQTGYLENVRDQAVAVSKLTGALALISAFITIIIFL
jgi:hypothetical protein